MSSLFSLTLVLLLASQKPTHESHHALGPRAWRVSARLRRDRPYERLDITGIQGLTQAQKVSLRALGAIESLS